MTSRVGAFYEALVGDTDAILATMDGQGTIVWISPEVRAVMGFEPGDVIGRLVADFLAPEEVQDGLRKIGDLMLNPGSLMRTVHRVRHADGTYRVMELVGRDLRARAEVGAIVVHMRDVTEERQAMQALEQSRARLAEAQRIAGLGWWELDLRSGEVEMSPELLGLLGWKRQPSRQWRELRYMFIHHEDVAAVEDAVRSRLADATTTSLEHRVVLPDGSVRQWQLRAQSFREARGRALRVAGTVMDVTALRQAEAENFRAQKLEALDLLAAGVAHDFNNLLSVIQGNLSLARVVDPSNAALPLLLEAEAACAQAARLAGQLSRYARTDGHRPYEPTPLASLLGDIVPLLVRGSRVRAEVRVPDDLRPVQGDRGEIVQVVQNLVLNALAAMRDGGELRAVADNVRLPADDAEVPLPAGRYVRLRIEDSGHGIAPEHLPRIFDPYFTTRREGQGLGLATTYHIVRRHKGHISVRSSTEQGTTFQVYLPASRGGVALPAQRGEVSAEILQPRTRVLLVDDDPMLRRVAVQLLEGLGCEVAVASDSNEAVRLAGSLDGEGQPYDVAIIDATMPGGPDAAELLRRLQSVHPALRGVVSSGYLRHEAMHSHRENGFRAALAKPYGISELRRALQAALGDAAATAL